MQVKRLKLSSQDAIGGITQATTTIFQVPCRIRRLNANEQFLGGKDGVVSTHRIYCGNVDIKNKDECIINKTVYDVNSINPTSSQFSKKGTVEIDVTLRV